VFACATSLLRQPELAVPTFLMIAFVADYDRAISSATSEIVDAQWFSLGPPAAFAAAILYRRAYQPHHRRGRRPDPPAILG